LGSTDYFPYEFRIGQKAFLSFIEKYVSARNICVEAPTGFGKTPLIISALLPYCSKGFKIIWAVRTGNETDRPVEELKVINRRLKERVFGISFRGKKDMCILLRDLELKNVSHSDAAYICRAYRKDCRYYWGFKKKFKPNVVLNEPLIYSEILSLGMEQGICPYMIERFLLKHASLISLSYNYILDKNVGLSISRTLDFSKCILVVDEAHNLQSATSNINSIKITERTIESSLKEIELSDMSKTAYRAVSRIHKYLEDKGEVEIDKKEFLKSILGDEGGVVEDLEKIADFIRKKKLSEGKPPRSSTGRICSLLKRLMDNAKSEGVRLIRSQEEDRLYIELVDMRLSEILGSIWRKFWRCIFCSGTLKPIVGFAEVIGLKDYAERVFPSYFDRSKIRSFILKGVSTRGEELSFDMANRYVKSIIETILAVDVSSAVFSASYRIQDSLVSVGLVDLLREAGRPVLVERKAMSGDEARLLLDQFKDMAKKGRKPVLLAVAMGRFAEGADFPGEELELVYLAGIPFERMTLKTQLLIEYYTNLYGDKGRFYAYVVPAIRRASQAVGRVLRSQDDSGIFILGDERYLRREYARLLPDYVLETVRVVDYRSLKFLVERLKT